LIILGVFIGVINNFLSGELSARFILKALAMFLISGLVFSYYFYDVKREEFGAKKKINCLFFSLSLLFVLGAFISAWFFVESPREARMRRLDQIVVNNINSLENAVNSFYSEEKRLPENLSELKDEGHIYDRNSLFDPESGKEIEYKKINEQDFEFCAEFRLASNPTDVKGRAITGPYNMPNSDDHELGYDCLKGDLWAEEKIDIIKAKETVLQ
jgi:vacuolar-type H+-ATPase subunit I/STV1